MRTMDLEATWRAMDERVEIHRALMRYHARIKTLGQRIRNLLNGYRQRPAAEDGSAVESFLTFDPTLF